MIILGKKKEKNNFVPNLCTNMTSTQGWKLALLQYVTSYVLECFLHPATPPCYPHKHTHMHSHTLFTQARLPELHKLPPISGRIPG